METKKCKGCKRRPQALVEFVNEEGKECSCCKKCREKLNKYRKSENGKRASKKYRESENGKQAKKIYNQKGDTVLYEYKRKADGRKIDWYLSDEYAKQMFKESCHYCGIEATKNQRNGIDRMDNSLGYIPSNCVPCCTRCNFAKCKLGYDEFIDLCTLISKRFNEQGTLRKSRE